MRVTTVFKILIFIIMAGSLSIFYVQNTTPVGIQFPFGRPHHFGLIYIIGIAYVAGLSTALTVVIMVNSKMSKKRKTEETEELVEDEE